MWWRSGSQILYFVPSSIENLVLATKTSPQGRVVADNNDFILRDVNIHLQACRARLHSFLESE